MVIKMKPSRKQGFFILTFFLIAIVWFFIVSQLHYECPWLSILHIYCPGCGGTRMIFSMIHLDFYQAFRYNPLLFIMIIVGLIYLLFMIVYYIKKKVILLPSKKFLYLFIGILIIYTIMRNMDAFVYLIPTEV